MVSDKFDVTLILFPFVWSVSFISTPTLMLSLFSSSFLEQFEYDVSWGVVLCILWRCLFCLQRSLDRWAHTAQMPERGRASSVETFVWGFEATGQELSGFGSHCWYRQPRCTVHVSAGGVLDRRCILPKYVGVLTPVWWYLEAGPFRGWSPRNETGMLITGRGPARTLSAIWGYKERSALPQGLLPSILTIPDIQLPEL